MSKITYYGRDGRPCQRTEWDRLKADPSYAMVRQYDNGKVKVEVEWLGNVIDAPNMFRDCWPLFRLHVFNYNDQGAFVRDPVEIGRTFPTEAAAIKAYELFLEHWTNSHRNDDGEFVEEDNDLAPPPPPNPDAPTTSAMSAVSLGDDDVGAW